MMSDENAKNSITLLREVSINHHQELAMFATRKERYAGKFRCDQTMPAYELKLLYKGKYPRGCPAGDSFKDSGYYTCVPGYDHPHVIMMDDSFYMLNISLP